METSSANPTLPRFDIKNLYVKEQSCKLPHAPGIFQGEWKPEVQLELNVKQEKLAPDQYEVSLRLSLTAKNQQRTAFILDVQQAGIFILENIPAEHLDLLLQAHCPTILYPYARKVVADAIFAAGLPSLALAPINFEAAYYQQQAQANKKADTATAQLNNHNNHPSMAEVAAPIS